MSKIVTRKPRTPSLRFQTFIDTRDLTKKEPEKSLVTGCKRRSGGRNCYGRITTRHRGGGADRKYRIIDFKRSERTVSGTIASIEYDPNRNVRIALVIYKNGAKAYMLMPENLKIGATVVAGVDVEAAVGNCLPLRNIPVGFMVHNIEVVPGKGGKLVRSAGMAAQIVGKENNYAIMKLPSGEMRFINLDCWATVGVLGNAGHKNICFGKAGRTRHRGFRPSVRGMAMNPVDHPRGGGEGRSKSGSQPMSPWGKGKLGVKTRTRVSRFIIKRRK